jgi:tryptophanyl-tRNA synthetase
MQEENHCFFFIADYHSLTTHPTPVDLYGNVRSILVNYLAAGLDYEKSIIFRQSDVPEVAELYLFLNMNAYVGELQRVASFKDKIRTQPNNVNAGLLTYPSLMAADILLHRASKVPVGKDQEQHLEMTRNFAQRFNHMYKVDYFPEPIAYNFGNNLVKVPGLDGSTKMSKSDNENSCIYLADSADVIRKKVMRAVSDSGPTVPNQPKAQAVENLFSLLKIVSTSDTIHFFEEQYAQCSIRYGDLKKQLAEDMVNFCAPIRERILEIDSDQAFLIKVAQIGAEKARESAQKTMKEVREIIGFRSL